jgi:hypothetical protein
VSIVGSNIAQSVAGASQAERSQVQEKRHETARAAENRARRREDDEAVVRTEAVEAARRLAGNDQEETREDRQSHSYYTPGGLTTAGEGQLDLEG